jgi:hypothetical protein
MEKINASREKKRKWMLEGTRVTRKRKMVVERKEKTRNEMILERDRP